MHPATMWRYLLNRPESSRAPGVGGILPTRNSAPSRAFSTASRASLTIGILPGFVERANMAADGELNRKTLKIVELGRAPVRRTYPTPCWVPRLASLRSHSVTAHAMASSRQRSRVMNSSALSGASRSNARWVSTSQRAL
jgi:hypothetical protein